MKNLFKLAFVALALATTVSACSGNADKDNDTTLVDTHITIDSNIVIDSNVVDTVGADTASKM